MIIRKPSRRRVARTASISAPTGGWNARDSIADMDEKDAVILTNYFPTTSDVALREGWDEYADDLPDQVETLMSWNAPSGTVERFAISDGKIYDITAGGSVGSPEVSGLTNSRSQYVNYTLTDGTSWLCSFNGQNKPNYYNGTSWVAVDGSSTPAITGVDSDKLNSPWIHKRRLWVVEAGALNAWYLPAGAVGGTASKFAFDGVFRLGGRLVAGATWTLDSGEGLDDYFVVVTSQGEVAVYQGTDPSSTSTWGIVGVWRIGEPIGSRCMLKWAGDLLIICKDGVFPISRALITSQTNREAAITDKIEGAMSTAAQLYSLNFGWEMQLWPTGDKLFLNVPVAAGQQEQYVMNTVTGSWCRFTNMHANCWMVSNEQLYFGGNGYVGQFGTRLDDNGSNIDGEIQQAFSYFRSRGRLKRWTMLRPLIATNGSPSVDAGVNVDYEQDVAITPLIFTPSPGAVWDTGVWDAAVWGGGLTINKQWRSVSALGNTGGLRLRSASKGIEVRLQASDYVLEDGEVI